MEIANNGTFAVDDTILGITLLTILCIIICNYFYHFWPRSLKSTMNSSPTTKQRVVFIFAHPDDEAMFFVPTIKTLLQQQASTYEIYWLCLCTGNADGLGAIRSKELYASGKVLSIPEDHITILNHSQLIDGMGIHWDTTLVQAIITQYIQQHHINMVITFDQYGISGHSNHISVWRGVVAALSELATTKNIIIPGYTLTTVNFFRKFLGLLDIPYSLIEHYYYKTNSKYTQSTIPKHDHPSHIFLYGGWKSFRLAHLAMQAHYSQYVWFRRLFIIFSRYAIMNSLQVITLKTNNNTKDK